ncbi:MAG: biopolymer transporter ExbD [Chitinispirillaceae bacterium]|nr:biopolymer transporter ExbD [Chitinispirillaceae bacterium]
MFDKVFSDFDGQVTRAELSMTPLIDMVFLLLIFFAVTTNFTKETGIKVDKASASTARMLNKDLLLIAIDEKGNYWYDGNNRPLAVIVNRVQEEIRSGPQSSVILLPDKNGRVEPLVGIMDALRQRGISRFSIGTKKKAEE